MIDENTIKIVSDLAEKFSAQSVAYIKLIKNSKGYNWEIKQLSLDLVELEKINNELITKFDGE